jgi:1,4-dihydroxy-2-naphthoate octaprenyltransferase
VASVLRSWVEVLQTQNLSSQRPVDPVSRWLLITRASVLPMTVISAALGGLLALGGPAAAMNWLYLLEALIGLLLAHAANNMLNDYFDWEEGIDSEQSVRGRYAPHPILSGLTSRRGLLTAIALTNLLDLAILVHLTAARGWPIVGFALAGGLVSLFYVAPPLRLKHRGLGEPAVFLVWGPLMVGGTYYAATGELRAWVLALSLPYALLVTAVLLGKHLDKLEADAARGVGTLPVRLGAERGRWLAQASMVGCFALVVLFVLSGALGLWSLVVLLAMRRLIDTVKVFGRAAPESPPENYPIWPLWYVAWAFRLTRFTGALFVASLAANAILPLSL